MQISISIYGVSVSVQDDDVIPFETVEEGKAFALDLLDAAIRRDPSNKVSEFKPAFLKPSTTGGPPE
jgi:hypothetical protein